MNNLIGKFRKKKPVEEKQENGTSSNYGHEEEMVTISYRASSSKEPPSVSQLAYTLDRLLNDSSALSYFIQYLEATDKLNLIKFWMHVEGFKVSVSDNKVAQKLSELDAKNIFDKYIDEQSNASLALPKKVIAAVEDKLRVKPLTSACFDSAQTFVRQLFQFRYFEEFQASVYYKKHELSVLESGCSFEDLLKVQPLLQSLLDFIKNPSDHHMVQFLLACESYEANVDQMEDGEALEDAMSLYEKYFSMQAPSQIDFGPAVRAEIESFICDESGRPHVDSFRTAKVACIIQLQDKYLHDFSTSFYYTAYLDELRVQIDNTLELPSINRRAQRSSDTGSDAQSSTDSLTSVFNRHVSNMKSGRSQRDDVTEKTPICSPRTPRTPRSSRLAEIDELGRYHPLYDDSHCYLPQNKRTTPSGRIKNTLRKYLDKDSLKEEEIAEEVARSIILDMQNMVNSANQQKK